MVRAKFKVVSKTKNENGESIRFEPVRCCSPENELFFKYTPWGAIEIGTVNQSAADQFEVGKEYYVDFTSA